MLRLLRISQKTINSYQFSGLFKKVKKADLAQRHQIDKFRKEIQKISNLSMLIQVYKRAEMDIKSLELLAITCRIATRILPQKIVEHETIVKQIFGQDYQKMKHLKTQSLTTQNMKDIFIFLSKIVIGSSDNKSYMLALNLLLEKILKSVAETSPVSEKNFSLAVTCCQVALKITHKTYTQYLSLIADIIRSSPSASLYIKDNLTFRSILGIMTMFDFKDIDQKIEFVELICEKMFQDNYYYQFNSIPLVRFYGCLLQFKPFEKSNLVKSAKARYQIEIYILNKIRQMNYNTIKIINDLSSKEAFNSLALLIPAELMLRSLKFNNNPLNPYFIVKTYTQFCRSKRKKYEIINENWQTKLLAILEQHFKKDTKFVMLINRQIRKLIIKNILDWQKTIELYNFYRKEKKLVDTLDIKIRQTIYQSKLSFRMYDVKEGMKSLKSLIHFLEFLLKKIKKQDKLPILEQQKKQVKKLYQSLRQNYQLKDEQIDITFRQRFDQRSIQIIRFMEDLNYDVMSLKISLHEYTMNLNEIDFTNNITSIHQKISFIKLIFSNYRPGIYEYKKKIQLLKKICGNTVSVEQDLNHLIKTNILPFGGEISTYQITFLHHFYETYSKQLYHRLIFLQPKIFEILLHLYPEKVLNYIYTMLRVNELRQSYHHLVCKLLRSAFKFFIPKKVLITFLRRITFYDSLMTTISSDLAIMLSKKNICNNFDSQIQAKIQREVPQAAQSFQELYTKAITKEKEKYPYFIGIQRASNRQQISNYIINFEDQILKINKDETLPKSGILQVIQTLEVCIQNEIKPENNQGFFYYCFNEIKKYLKNNPLEGVYFRYKVLEIMNYLRIIFPELEAHIVPVISNNIYSVYPLNIFQKIAQRPKIASQNLIFENLDIIRADLNLSQQSVLKVFCQIKDPSQKIQSLIKQLLKLNKWIPPYLQYYIQTFYPSLMSNKEPINLQKYVQIEYNSARISLNFVYLQKSSNIHWYDITTKMKIPEIERVIVNKIIRQKYPNKHVHFGLKNQPKDQSK